MLAEFATSVWHPPLSTVMLSGKLPRSCRARSNTCAHAPPSSPSSNDLLPIPQTRAGTGPPPSVDDIPIARPFPPALASDVVRLHRTSSGSGTQRANRQLHQPRGTSFTDPIGLLRSARQLPTRTRPHAFLRQSPAGSAGPCSDPPLSCETLPYNGFTGWGLMKDSGITPSFRFRA